VGISLIAALSNNSVIGVNGKIPWELKEDLTHFKETTLGSAIIMGRKTFESIGKPLAERLNIVMTSNPKGLDGIQEVSSIENAIKVGLNFSENIFVIGGQSIYETFLPISTKMYLTFIDIEVSGDTFFPKWDKSEWEEVSRKRFKNKIKEIEYSFVEFNRKPF
jgi:dihydrofolate reductase